MAERHRPALNRSLILRLALIAVILITAILLGLASFGAVRATVLSQGKAGSQTGLSFSASPFPTVVNELGTPLPPNTSAPNPNAPITMPTLTPWDGASRVTVLLLGLDYRDWQAGEKYSRSDTMILLTLDPLTKSAGILSIPRDMWVAIPGFQHGKINTAYFLGDAYKLPGGGPGLAVKTVEQFVGVPINYYAQVDFDAFVRFIDEIGGVKINVPQKITVDLLGGGGAKTKKTLQPGVQTLPGQWALAYARMRYTENGDFDRADRQQQVIMAVRDKVLSLNILPTLIAKAPTLYNELSTGIHTNLSLDDAIKLALLAQQVPSQNIRRGVFGKGYTIFGWSPDNLSILVPIPDKIHLLRDQIFADKGSLSPFIAGSSQQQMQAEAARVAVFNASQNPGLGSNGSAYLKSQGMNIVQTGDSNKKYAATLLIDHTGNPYTLKYLAELMKISPDHIYTQADLNSPVDVEIYLGNDWTP
jgi:LCP family protein required for cell wall assembly